MEQKKRDMMSAGLISGRFPEVAKIVFHMTYYEKASDSVLMVRTLNFIPTDYATFHMDCTREECKKGGFDLNPIVTSLVRSRKKTMKGKLFCHGKSEALRIGHSSIDFKIDIQYNRHIKTRQRKAS